MPNTVLLTQDDRATVRSLDRAPTLERCRVAGADNYVASLPPLIHTVRGVGSTFREA